MIAVLVLWDIDHTLIETRGVGGQIYADAFQAVTGHRLEKMPHLAGRTEPVIFREALAVNGLPDTANALRTLHDRDDAVQSVLTGNTREAAALKLQAFNLDHYLRLDLAAAGAAAPKQPSASTSIRRTRS
jgi:phosphoglycolate phosphatase-like HAD superfamily hydrolase